MPKVDDHLTKLQSELKAYDRELKVLHKNPETSYVEEGFSGISNAAMVFTSWDQINEDYRFPNM